MAANPLDRLIGFFDPTRALKRVVDRTRLQRAYEAASPRDTWKPRRGGASAQADHRADAATLRAKARSLVQNVPYIATSMDALVANVIGTGITPRFTGAQADLLNTLWQRWTQVCDADGRLDFYGLQAAAYRAMEQDGEVLVRLRPRRPADNLPVPLQIQLLEIDWLDSSRNSGSAAATPGLPAGNTIIDGIEYDALSRVAAYWLWDQHPGDVTLRRGTRTQSKRIEADKIIHLFDPKRPGQGRGISRLAPIIARTRDTQLYEDAEIARKNLESRLSVLVSGDASLMANDFQTSDGASSTTTGASTAQARRTGDLGELASGSITEIPAGNTVTTIEPKPAGGHVEYVKHQLHIITAALGVTYEMATGDMTEVNFSSARVRGLDVRRGFEHTQWMVFIPRYCRPLCDAFAAAAELAGKVSPSRYALEYDCPKWDYVNPQQEATADALQVATGLASLSSKLRARGENPDRVFEEIAADFGKLKTLGVLDTLIFLQKGKTESTDQAANEAEDAKATKRSDTEERRHSEMLAAFVGVDRTVNVKIGDTHQGDTHVVVPEREVRIDSPVTVNQGDVHVPEREVRIESPVTVNQGDQHVTVPEREVHIDGRVNVQTARRQETTEIEHDGAGRIKRLTRTEG